jgi:hypothetical protein
MASATYPTTTGFTGKSDAKQGNGAFVPKLWSDETIAAYEQSIKMAPLVRRMPMNGKKGDTIIIPKATRGSANAKAENTAVTVTSRQLK